MNKELWWNDSGRGTAWRETCPSATVSTTNLMWTGLGLNAHLHNEGW